MSAPVRLQRRHVLAAGTSGTVLPLMPLIDISLMLAVLLIAVMDADRHETQVPVQLPAAASGQASQPGLVITIDGEGATSVASKTVTVAELRKLAQGQSTAIIRADGAVPHRQVIAVVDVLRQAGVNKVLYGTEPGVVEW